MSSSGGAYIRSLGIFSGGTGASSGNGMSNSSGGVGAFTTLYVTNISALKTLTFENGTATGDLEIEGNLTVNGLFNAAGQGGIFDEVTAQRFGANSFDPRYALDFGEVLSINASPSASPPSSTLDFLEIPLAVYKKEAASENISCTTLARSNGAYYTGNHAGSKGHIFYTNSRVANSAEQASMPNVAVVGTLAMTVLDTGVTVSVPFVAVSTVTDTLGVGGTVATGLKFDCNGSSAFRGNLRAFANVGIGKDPTLPLDVVGNASITGAVSIGSLTTAAGVTVNGSFNCLNNVTVGATLNLNGNISQAAGKTAVIPVLTTTSITNSGNVGTATLSTTGAATVGTTLSVTGNTTLAATTAASANVTGALQVGGNASVTGNTLMGGTLGVSGATTLSSVTVTGPTALGSTNVSSLTATGNVTAQTLNASGVSTLAITNVSGALSVTANSTFTNVSVGGTLGVTGASTVAALTASGALTAQANATINGVTTLARGPAASTLTITPNSRQNVDTSGFVQYDIPGTTGTHFFWDNVEVSGNLACTGTANTFGASTFASSATTGSSSVGGNFSVTGSAQTGPLNSSGALVRGGTAAVSGNASGLYTYWNNLTSGGGIAEFVNNRGGGTGGFTFYTNNGVSGAAPVQIFRIGADGTGTFAGNCVVGNAITGASLGITNNATVGNNLTVTKDAVINGNTTVKQLTADQIIINTPVPAVNGSGAVTLNEGPAFSSLTASALNVQNNGAAVIYSDGSVIAAGNLISTGATTLKGATATQLTLPTGTTVTSTNAALRFAGATRNSGIHVTENSGNHVLRMYVADAEAMTLSYVNATSVNAIFGGGVLANVITSTGNSVTTLNHTVNGTSILKGVTATSITFPTATTATIGATNVRWTGATNSAGILVNNDTANAMRFYVSDTEAFNTSFVSGTTCNTSFNGLVLAPSAVIGTGGMTVNANVSATGTGAFSRLGVGVAPNASIGLSVVNGLSIAGGGSIAGALSTNDISISGTLNVTTGATVGGTTNFTRGTTGLAITPNMRQTVESPGVVQYDIGGTGTHYFWDNVEISNNLLAQGTNRQGNNSQVWTITSDRRLKKDIVPHVDGLAVVEKLQPVSFKYNGRNPYARDDGVTHIGLIAQDSEQVLPRCIRMQEDEIDGEMTDVYSMDNSELVFTLINAVKEMSVELKSLRSRVKTLEDQRGVTLRL